MKKIILIILNPLQWLYGFKTRKFNQKNIENLLKDSFQNSIQFKVSVSKLVKIKKKSLQLIFRKKSKEKWKLI